MVARVAPGFSLRIWRRALADLTASAPAREREARTLVTATGVSADPGGTETKPEQNLHDKLKDSQG